MWGGRSCRHLVLAYREHCSQGFNAAGDILRERRLGRRSCGVEVGGRARLGRRRPRVARRRKDLVLCRPFQSLLISRAGHVPLLALQTARSSLVAFELCLLSARVPNKGWMDDDGAVRLYPLELAATTSIPRLCLLRL